MHKDRFVVKGLGGKKTLKGEIKINGAKNAVLKAMSASVLFDDSLTIGNVPNTEDVKKMSSLLSLIGMDVKSLKNNALTIEEKKNDITELDKKISESMRASVVLTGPILARYGKVSFYSPGGCVIGARPIDLFLESYKKMGAKIDFKHDKYTITALGKGGKLKGAEIFFDIQTVGGTETMMLTAILAEGKTVLKNCALEPEIANLAEYLISCGAKIKGAGTSTIEIIGGRPLISKGKVYKTIPDRIEAGSFLILGALCADNLIIKNCKPEHIEVLISMLQKSGVPIRIKEDSIFIENNGKIKNSFFKSFNVRTHEYPGFPTDLQSAIVIFLTQTTGESIVFETIYEGRFKYTQNIVKMSESSKINIMNNREILIRGPIEFKAPHEESLDAFDIRAGFATVIASLIAKGTSTIENVYFIDRGYESLENRLRNIGADIERVSNNIEKIGN